MVYYRAQINGGEFGGSVRCAAPLPCAKEGQTCHRQPFKEDTLAHINVKQDHVAKCVIDIVIYGTAAVAAVAKATDFSA